MLILNFKDFICPQEPSVESKLLSYQNWHEANLGFGKFANKDINDIPKPYLQWVVDNVTWLKPAVKAEIQARLGSRASNAVLPSQNQQAQVAAPKTWWIKASVIGNNPSNLPIGTPVALSQMGQNWNFITLDGKNIKGSLPNQNLNRILQSEKDATGKTIKTDNINNWLPKKADKSPLIPDNLMSEEQRAIDAKFEKLLASPNKSHIMISALAGTGKTTMLKHLAWKYGRPGQKWLYIVFNTTNKVEATEKFPPFVTVRTSNGFLGEVLKDKPNLAKMLQTERMVRVDKRLEKIRLIADSGEFVQEMAKLGIPANPNFSHYPSMYANNLTSLMKQIRYSLKEQMLLLAGLAKSFALDPRNAKALDDGIKNIFDKYDFDTDLPDIKERIARYNSDNYRANIKAALNEVFKTDFMHKDFKDEITKGTKWLLNLTMPGKVNMPYKQGIMTHQLGEYRDFNDDLWFAAVHANEIDWPKYDIVLADEVQDFNEAQKTMLKKLSDAGAKVVAVGDKNQAIYRFRGADGEAFDNVTNQLKNLSHDKNVTQELTTNFRSRKAILDFVNEETHVKNLKGRVYEDGDEGKVSKGVVKYDDTFSELKKENQDGKLMQTAFIARTNEPLVHAALSLLAGGIPFVIVGKDIAADLKKHIAKIIGKSRINDDDYTMDLSRALNDFRQSENDYHAGSSTKKAYLQEVEEVTSALLAAIETFEQDHQNQPTVKEFKNWLAARLGGLDIEENEKDLKEYKKKLEENAVVLTTAHRSKGLEFERVYILRYDLFPHKKAKRPEDLQGEANLKYVALTRAMRELHVLDLDGQPGYKK